MQITVYHISKMSAILITFSNHFNEFSSSGLKSGLKKFTFVENSGENEISEVSIFLSHLVKWNYRVTQRLNVN